MADARKNPEKFGWEYGLFSGALRNAFRDPRNSPEKCPEKFSGPRSFRVFWEWSITQMDLFDKMQVNYGVYIFCNVAAYFSLSNSLWQIIIIWRSVWNKALSDFWCNIKFSLCFTREYKAIWKKNLAVYQKSLRVFFFQATLHLRHNNKN